ncbi:hypothetical protein PFLUV_G00125680 [Perca fluviatilis]|uniref:Uncharacterized protein n=1 Tax=Perca fluviatilis TaxID=8168 RepID=A0A6A5F773_PERFL|nr:hypothetical protein PFLUV_G00125680 [Perca fluviatilis]
MGAAKKRQQTARVGITLAVLGSAIVRQLSLLTRGFPGYLLNKNNRKKLLRVLWIFETTFSATESMKEDRR